MPFEVPMDDIETEKLGGFDRVLPGSYHQEVTFVDEDGGDKGEMIAAFECLRGTTANQEGKEIRIYFSKSMDRTARAKVHAFALATGLITKEELDKHKANGTSPSYDFTKAVGKQVCANYEENQYNGKISTRLIWDQIFHPTDKRANHIPLHMGKIKEAGIKLPEGRNPDGAVKSGAATGNGTAAQAKKSGGTAAQAKSVDELLG